MEKSPTFEEMEKARLNRDRSYNGVFWVGVRTMKVFCLPSCPARQPLDRNVVYFVSYKEAEEAGYRLCKRCQPQAPETMFAHQAEATSRQQLALPMDARRTLWRTQMHTKTDGTQGRKAILTRILQSPVGELLVGATEHGLCLVEYADRRCLSTQVATLEKRFKCRAVEGQNEHLYRIEHELEQYFQGQLKHFETTLDITGTPFERAVWVHLLEIPYGETVTYSTIARDLGRPGAQRAVGRANGANKMAIVIPCHRVIQATGTLRGYGGGLWRKQFLLDLERTSVARLGLGA